MHTVMLLTHTSCLSRLSRVTRRSIVMASGFPWSNATIIVQEGQPEQQLLCARALWLIGVCGTDLPNEHWAAAYQILVHYMSVQDLVLCLTALGAVLAMTAVVLEEASALEQAEEAVLHMQRQIQRVRQLQQQQHQNQGSQGGRDGGLLRELPWQQDRFLQEQEQDLQVRLPHIPFLRASILYVICLSS